jgi:hypothetical protein
VQEREFDTVEDEQDFRRQFRQTPVNKAFFDPKYRFEGVILVAAPTLPAPQLIGLVPATIASAGGDIVTVSGLGFGNGAQVQIGGTDAIQVVFVDSTTLTVTTPAGAVGTADIVVVNPDGQSSNVLQDAVTYV